MDDSAKQSGNHDVTGNGTAIIVSMAVVFIGFGVMYGNRLLNRFNGPAIHYLKDNLGGLGTFGVHIIFFALFLLALQLRFKTDWLSSGMFTAFMISLFGEMFGAALFVYLFSNRFFPYPSWEVPGGILYTTTEAARMSRYFGAWLILAGLIIIAFSWYYLYNNRGKLVTTGIYACMRHPQYLGFIVFTLGWMVYWPTLLNLFLWPMLAFVYIRQGLREDRYLGEKYREEFQEYKKHTGMFWPVLF